MFRTLLITLFIGLINMSNAFAESNAVIYEFYAPWCHVCKMLEPKLAKIEKQGTHIVRINIDENEQMASKYHVRAVPTVILVKDGKVKESYVGDMSMQELKALASEAAE